MSSPQAVIDGMLASYRTMADGTLRITIDLEEAQSIAFHELFPTVHGRVAIAPLNSDSQEKDHAHPDQETE